MAATPATPREHRGSSERTITARAAKDAVIFLKVEVRIDDSFRSLICRSPSTRRWRSEARLQTTKWIERAYVGVRRYKAGFCRTTIRTCRSERRQRMIRVTISVEAFEAIARTLPLGSLGCENKTNEKEQRLIWLAPTVIDRLRAMRGPGELQRRDCGDRGGGRVRAIACWQSRSLGPSFYSLPQQRCYARHGVDRPASRHAGLRSLLPRPPQRSMEARPCSSQ